MRIGALVVLMLMVFASAAALAQAAPNHKSGKRSDQQPQTIVVPPAQVTVTVPPVPQPVAVDIKSEPERRTDWWFVGTNFPLVIFGAIQTWMAIRASKASESSSQASRQSAESAHASLERGVVQQHETILREASAAVSRVSIRAQRVAQLAAEVRPRVLEIAGLAGMSVDDDSIARHDYVASAEQQRTRAAQIERDVLNEAGRPLAQRSDEDLSALLRQMDEYQLQLEAMQEAILGRLEGLREEWVALFALRARERASDHSLG
jgi:hypothetical protein